MLMDFADGLAFGLTTALVSALLWP